MRISKTLLQKKLSELGLDNHSNIIATTTNPEVVIEELTATNESIPEYTDEITEISNAITIILDNVIKTSNSEEEKSAATSYKEEIKKAVAENLKSAIASRIDSNILKASILTERILDKGLDFAGIKRNPENKHQEEMRKMILLLISIVAMLFLKHFGLSPETMAIAGMLVQYLDNNGKDRSKIDVAKDVAKKILHNEHFRESVAEKVISSAEAFSPQIAGLNIREKISACKEVAQDSNIKKLSIKTQILLKTLEEINKPASLLHADLYSSIHTILEENLQDNPQLKDKLLQALESAKEKSRERFIEKSAKLQEDREETKNIGTLIQKSFSVISTLTESLDDLKNSLNTGLTLTQQEKMILGKIEKEAKEYLHQKYSDPISGFAEVANSSPKTIDIVSQMGISKSMLQSISHYANKFSSKTMTKLV